MGTRTKKIQALQVAGDIRNGMDDTALMLKYDLSPKQLRSLMEKLREAGLLERARSEYRVRPEDESPNLTFTCPACGAAQPDSFDECPLCGVVVSKFAGGHKQAGAEHSATVSGYGSSFGAGASDLMSSKYGTRLFSIIVIFVVGICGIFAYRWLAQSRSERALVQNVRPMLEYLVGNVADDFDWEDGAEKFQKAVKSSRGPFQIGRPELYANLNRIHGNMVRIAELKKDIEDITPHARKEARRRLQPEIEQEIALFLEDKLARVRAEVVPKLVADRWNEFADALKQGRVVGNPAALKHFNSPQMLKKLREEFEKQLKERIEARLQWAEDRIRNREFLRTPAPGPERFMMRFPSRWGKLEVKAEVNVLGAVFNKEELEGKVSNAVDKGIESSLASEETQDLEATNELESLRNQLEKERSALVTACLQALENMNRED